MSFLCCFCILIIFSDTEDYFRLFYTKLLVLKRPVQILCILCRFAAKCCSCLELTIFTDFFWIFSVLLLIKMSFFPIWKWNFTKSNNFTDRFWWSRDLIIKWENIFWPLGVINRCLRHKLKKRFEGQQRTVQYAF